MNNIDMLVPYSAAGAPQEVSVSVSWAVNLVSLLFKLKLFRVKVKVKSMCGWECHQSSYRGLNITNDSWKTDWLWLPHPTICAHCALAGQEIIKPSLLKCHTGWHSHFLSAYTAGNVPLPTVYWIALLKRADCQLRATFCCQQNAMQSALGSSWDCILL